MNKTIPKDGKQHRQSQNYVPSGPIIGRTYWLNCSVSDAKRDLGKYGTITVLYDRATYNTSAYCREAINKKVRQRNKIMPIRNHVKNVPQIKIIFSTDQEGHDLAYDALCDVNSYYGAIRMWRKEQAELEKEVVPTNRPPVIKRLTGKERKIAKKKAAENVMNEPSEE